LKESGEGSEGGAELVRVGRPSRKKERGSRVLPTVRKPMFVADVNRTTPFCPKRKEGGKEGGRAPSGTDGGSIKRRRRRGGRKRPKKKRENALVVTKREGAVACFGYGPGGGRDFEEGKKKGEKKG